ncbi:MAG: tRNA (adenosine(37)-N6)-threonylcarbamoyltransferase complex transferase subunit TsaD [Dysgonamonadaceae bacterium]|jgi:N6-L-threonylcarbamoyladenine synthase|nr:tRNA (adenosine(37)-N6)-threonylcarbamoyltransferase complex transferase subunit TsaD [Dysgonamonadaceae bacterium]
MNNDIILGIETSCDDTAVALVDSEGRILSSVVASQLDVHNRFGGIYPEFAARAHITAILPAVDEAFRVAGIAPRDVKAIGVTRGPGLIGSLLVGLNAAAGLGLGWNKPVIGVNHLRGHLRSADLERQRVVFPATVLLVSGGHTLLAYMKSAVEIELLGSTADDSVGETYDKVGRMMGLDYPGGPAVDRLAGQGKATISFPRPVINKGLAFSFSGLKSAVLRFMEANPDAPREDVAASFVRAVMDVLMKKSRLALTQYPSLSFAIVGGVAASPQLRDEAAKLCKRMKVELCLPPLRWSTDNAAMIALAAFDYLNLEICKEPVADLQLTMDRF